MSRLVNILFYFSLGLIPTGIIFRNQDISGGNFFLALGLAGILIFFLVKIIKSLIQNSNNVNVLIFYFLIILMTITVFTKYLYYDFWDYPTILIVPLFIFLSIFYLIKEKRKNIKVILTTILYLILIIPLFGIEFYKSPSNYIPLEWYNKYNVSASIKVNLPYRFKYLDTEQLSIKAFELRASKEYFRAIQLYKEARKIEPENPKLLFDMSEAYARINDLETAITLLDTAVMLDSNQAIFYLNRGLLHYKNNSVQKAIADYKIAIQIDSTHYEFFSNLALVYFYGEKNIEKACEALSKSEKLGLNIKEYKELIRIKRKCLN